MKRVSIKDIARQAGVVPSTVSFVLNGKAKEMRISDEVANKVRAVAEETGYEPNRTAVSLRTGRTKILGLIVEDISNVFFAKLAKIIEDEAYAMGYKILYCSTENDKEKGCELVKMLLHQQVEGFLITPAAGMEREISRLVELNKPVVMMDRYFPGMNIPSVLVDNYGGVKEGMEHLLNKGYRKIAFITVDLNQIQMQQRETAYVETMKAYGIPEEEQVVLKLPYKSNAANAVDRISEFIKEHQDLEAIFFPTNYLGVYGLESIKNLGLSIPGDLAIVCFDDHDIFRLYTPGITIIKQPIEEIATTAIHLLTNQLEDKQQAEELYIFKKPSLVLRGST
jgi:LacI family transcriptional regulator